MIRAILIDDEVHCLDTLNILLTDCCPDVNVMQICPSPKKGLEAIEKLKPELVFLDIEMPLLNGYEVAKKIRESGSNVSIIAMTGHDSENEKQKCISVGMNSCISKPFDKEKLYSLILAQLNLPYSNPLGKEQRVAMDAPKGVTDLSHLREISKGRKAFFMSMIEIFLEQNQEDMNTLQVAVRDEDFDTIRLLAHKIATSITFMGLEKHIYAQLIDDVKGATLVAASSLEKPMREGAKTGANIAAAKAVGKLIAERAKEKGIKDVVFDRGGYLYHGRIKALADAAREGGLNF